MLKLLRALAGQGDFAPDLVRGIQLRVGMVLLSLVAGDFVRKSRGGVGTDGVSWPPLKPETIARRRTSAAERKSLGITGRRERGLLTMSENKEWRKIFATRKAWLIGKFGLSEEAASAKAAQIAWNHLKGMGAKTKLAVLGGRVVEQLRDTGRLFQSLSPGLGGADQILRAGPGSVTVGTNVSYAARVHKRRPLWPVGGKLPEAYTRPLLDALKRGVMEAVTILVAQGR